MKRLVLELAIAALVATTGAHAALVDDVRKNQSEAALAAIQQGADANSAEANGTTALMWAVHNGDLPLITALIKAEANVNARNAYGATAMSEAAVLGNADIIRALLKAGADVESPNADGQTALMVVARSSNVEAAQVLLQAGANVNATEQWKGQNAVLWAAAQSQPAMLKVLLEAGGDANSRSMPNPRDRQISAERRFQWRPAGGFTALAYAAREGCAECVKLLLAAGAEIDKGDVENVTPLNLAILNFHFDTAKVLIDAGANVDKWSFRGENPVYSAVDVNTVPKGGYPDRPSTDANTALDILELLLEKGANPNLQMKLMPTYRHIKDDRGSDPILGAGATPLLRAAKAFDAAALELLLSHGALVDLPGRNGMTPLLAATGLGSNATDTRGDVTNAYAPTLSKRAVEVLLAHGADVNARDANGRTALFGAANWGYNDLIELLVAKGVDPNIKDKNGMTAYDVALGKGPNGRVTGTPRPATAALLTKLMQ